jgi:MipA family protein
MFHIGSDPFACLRTVAGGVFAAWIAIYPGWLVAQEQLDLETTAAIELDPLTPDPTDGRSWQFRVGVLAVAGSEFDGSDDYDVKAVPYARVAYKDWVVLRGRSIEANLVNTHGLRIGPLLRTRGGRDEDEADFLNGFGDVDRAWEAGGFLRLSRGPLRLRVRAAHDVADAHDGLVVDINGGIQLPMENPWLILRAGATWADSDYMGSFFGVNADQSTRAGIASFSAGAGFKDAGVSISSRCPIGEHISAVISFGYRRLLGDAADSPIVSDFGDADQFFGTVGAIYSF